MPLPKINNSKNDKKEKSPVAKAFINSGFLLLYSLAFNVFAWFFIGNNVAWYVKILVGIAFLFPGMIMCFARGTSMSEKEFRNLNNAVLTDVHEQSYVNLHRGLPFLYVAPFVVIPIFICFVGIISKIQFFQGLVTFFFMPGTLIFMGLGLFPKISVISWYALLAVAFAVILQSIAFVLGYYKGIANVKKKNKELASEIRSFD